MIEAAWRASGALAQLPTSTFIGPRTAMLVIWIFTPAVSGVSPSLIWPIAGLLFAPLTALTYAFALNVSDSPAPAWVFAMCLALIYDSEHSIGPYGRLPFSGWPARLRADIAAARRMILASAAAPSSSVDRP